MARARPMRTCVGCRGTGEKPAMIRVVRGGGGAEVDPARSATGRGAYVHPNASCVEAAFEKHGFERALRTGLAPGEAVRLRNDLERLIGVV